MVEEQAPCMRNAFAKSLYAELTESNAMDRRGLSCGGCGEEEMKITTVSGTCGRQMGSM